jgi:hypothetical protein
MTSIAPKLALNIVEVALIAFVPISLVLLAQQRVLNPLYGSYPTLYSLDTVVSVAIFASILKPFRVTNKLNWFAAGLLLTIAPNASYWVAVWTAREGWPVIGPALTHAVVVGPLVFIFTNIAAQVCDGLLLV